MIGWKMFQAIKIKDIDVVFKIEVYHAHQKKRFEKKDLLDSAPTLG